MSQGNSGYSEAATVEAFRWYYEFLTKLYLSAAAVKQPPPTGWPAVTREVFAPLGKDETVISLLAHLPYVNKEGCGLGDLDDIECAAYCHFTDWHAEADNLARHAREGCGADGGSTSEDIREEIGVVTEGPGWDKVPAHVVGLTWGGRDQPVMLLDTRRGVVYWLEAPASLIGYHAEYGRAPARVEDDDEAWEFAGDAAVWSIHDFFEVLKEEFRALRMVPKHNCRVLDIYTRHIGREELVPTLQDVFRAHGWPDDTGRFDKDRCLAEVQRVIQTRFTGGSAGEAA